MDSTPSGEQINDLLQFLYYIQKSEMLLRQATVNRDNELSNIQMSTITCRGPDPQHRHPHLLSIEDPPVQTQIFHGNVTRGSDQRLFELAPELWCSTCGCAVSQMEDCKGNMLVKTRERRRGRGTVKAKVLVRKDVTLPNALLLFPWKLHRGKSER